MERASRPVGGLSPSEWEMVKDLVYDCRFKTEAEQIALLDGCPSEAIRTEAERMLRTPRAPEHFLKRPAYEQVFQGSSPELRERIGKYRISGVIGMGGMGLVCSAVDETLGRKVALKILHPETAVDPELQRRLLWEARVLSELNHPNIVTVYEAGSDDGADYIAMEYVSGSTLQALIAQGPLRPQIALEYAVQMATGLAAAHRAGIVHRDLKPSNLIVNDEGVVKLVDFGLGKMSAGAKVRDSPHTIQGQFAGTVAYMSPEQAEGDRVDWRSDIFSFGVVLYEMLTARQAFRGRTNVSTITQILASEPTPLSGLLPGLPREVGEIIDRCLRKDPDRRLQSADELRVRLSEALERIDRGAHHREERRLPRSVKIWPIAGILAGLLAGGGLIVLYKNRSPQTSIRRLHTRVTRDNAFATTPVLSPDGRIVAYASDRARRGDLDIWVQYLTGEPIRLTSDVADEHQPAFSPDGKTIYYRSERSGGGIYSVSSLGGPSRLIAMKGRNPTVSPSGEWVAFWVGEAGSGMLPGAARIFIAPTPAGEAVQFRSEFSSAAYPVWAPDSKRLLFLGRREKGVRAAGIDWWIASVGGTDSVATGAIESFFHSGLQPPPGMPRIIPRYWLPQSNSILFAATVNDATNIWRAGLNKAGKITEELEQWTSGVGLETEPTAVESNEGPKVVFTSQTRDTAIWTIPLDSKTGAPRSGPGRIATREAGVSSPSVSYDGARVAYSAYDPSGFKIVVVNSDRTAREVISVVRSKMLIRPIISGDGRYIVYRANRNGYRMDTAGGAPERLCTTCGHATHLNRNGSKALFEGENEINVIYQVTEKGIPEVVLRSSNVNEHLSGARYSPDERWITFSVARVGATEKSIFVAKPFAPESEWRRLSDPGQKDVEPTWSPDGRHIYFISDSDGFRCIFMRSINPSTGEAIGPPVPIIHMHSIGTVVRGNTPYGGEVGLSASDKELVFAVQNTTGEIWISTMKYVELPR